VSTEENLTLAIRWRNHVVGWRETLCMRLMESPQAPSGARWALEVSIKAIDKGMTILDDSMCDNLPLDELMREAGYDREAGRALGCLPEVRERIAFLSQRLDQARRGAVSVSADDRPATP
jgi:hypothetical protein